MACGSWAGSVWRGQCRELSLSDGGKVVLKLSSLRWRLRPSSLLRLRVGADFQSDWATGRATGRVAVTPAGTIQLREMSANSVLDSTALPALPAGWSGRIDHLGLLQIVTTRARAPSSLQIGTPVGETRWSEGRQLRAFHEPRLRPRTFRSAWLGKPLTDDDRRSNPP